MDFDKFSSIRCEKLLDKTHFSECVQYLHVIGVYMLENGTSCEILLRNLKSARRHCWDLELVD
jgi:hypothetical protein